MDADTGIKHYTTTSPGIGGEIKKKISDFVVNELSFEEKQLKTKAFGEWEEKRGQPLVIPENSSNEEYLHLTMEKFNLDTNNAIRRLARLCRCSQKRIGYAGMKDKRGITCQRISFWNPDTKLLEGFNSRYVSLSDPEWHPKRIDIGDLKGNSFEITIRNIELDENEIKKRTEQCFKEMENGVANYFGEQRFGGIRKITHRVGKEFIKGNFEDAVMLYLTSPAKGEEEEIALARKRLLETKDFSQASKEYPSKFRYERAIIHHLCKFPKDFVGAFQNLPKHLIYMFTHAYQSYLFNEIINTRIEEGIGLDAVEGDVIEDGVVTAPLLGFESKFAGGIPGEIEQQVLDKNNVKLEEFKVKSFPELSCSGTRKKIKVIPKNLRIISVSEDELNEGKNKLKTWFSLDKGNYATTILRELQKTA